MALIDTPPLTTEQLALQRQLTVQNKVDILLTTPRQIFSQLLGTLDKNISAIWDDPNPDEVLNGLGTHAVELFELSAKTVGFLESLKPGCTSDIISKIKPTVRNGDGSVSLTP